MTCFVDAMDECRADEVEETITFFDDLGDFVSAHAKHFRICLSSRPYPNFRSVRSVGLELERQKGHDNDIRVYVEKRLIVDNEHLKKDLVRRIETKALGVFMWVVLVVQLLNKDDRCGNAHEIFKHLELIPGKLSDVLDELLTRGSCSSYLRPLLLLLMFSYNDLLLFPNSIHSAMIFGTVGPRDHVDATHSGCFDWQTQEKFILTASKGLVETVGYQHRVQFIHESVRTYFLNEGQRYLTSDVDTLRNRSDESDTQWSEMMDRETLLAYCHDELKRFCLRYILSIIARRRGTKRDYGSHDLSSAGSFPFFEYAIRRLWTHAETAHRHGIRQDSFLETMPSDVVDETDYYLRTTFPGYLMMKWPRYRKAGLLICRGCPELLKCMIQAAVLSESRFLELDCLLEVSASYCSNECTLVLEQAGAVRCANSTFGIIESDSPVQMRPGRRVAELRQVDKAILL